MGAGCARRPDQVFMPRHKILNPVVDVVTVAKDLTPAPRTLPTQAESNWVTNSPGLLPEQDSIVEVL